MIEGPTDGWDGRCGRGNVRRIQTSVLNVVSQTFEWRQQLGHSGWEAHRRLRLGWETLKVSTLLLPGTVIHSSSASVSPNSLELGKHNLAA